MSGRETPYQGDHRAFGGFHCHKCNHAWYSGNAWANKGQKCKSCGSMMYPQSLRPLRRQRPDSCDPMEYQPDGGKPAVTDTPTPTKPTGVDTPLPTGPEQQQFKTESMLLFEEAMKQGYIEVCIIKCLLLGTAGVGKTCLLHLLLDMLPPTLRQSTSCIKQAIRAICMKYCCDSEGNWQKVDSDKLHDLLAGSVKVANFDGAILPHNQEGVTTSTEPLSDTMEVILKRLEEKPMLGKLQDMTWVYLVDSGGQPQFHELLTAFVRNALVGIFVHKLSERLDDHPHVEYFNMEGEQCGGGYPSPLTNRDIFQHCVQTMQSLPYTCTTEEDICPKLAVVGTYRDEEDQLEGESRDEKNEQLLKILRPIRDNVFLRTGRLEEVIFPVNAKSPDPEDKAIAKQLRQAIESLKPPAEKIPLQWYGLELELEKEALKKGRLVFTWDECIQVAQRLHFQSDKALDAALVHLDKLNIFLYYPSVLPGLVFLSPCVLQDKISELVDKSYRLKHDHGSHYVIPGELLKFCHKGQVTPQLLEEYPKHYTGFFTQAHLLKLFESLLIVAPIGRDVYFMPSLLDVLKQSEFYRSSCGCPLVICFKGGCVPLGLFSSLIAFLLSDKNAPNAWVIAGDSPRLYRNHIPFGLGDSTPGSVTLIDNSAFFEVHVTVSLHALYKDTCRYVSRSIERGLKKAIKARNFQNVDYEKAVSCPCKEGHHTLHPALLRTPVYGTQILQCTKKPSECGEVDECHRVWLENHTDSFGVESSPTEEGTPVKMCQKKEVATEGTPVQATELNNSPTLPELLNFQGRKEKINIAQEISTQFTTFGILLLEDRTGTTVAAITDKHRGNAELIIIEIFRKWLTGNGKPVSWRTLIGVLRDTGLNVLAGDIEDAF